MVGSEVSAEVLAVEAAAMHRALELARDPAAPLGPNPRVGAVIIGADGEVVGEGFHMGAGTAHAEIHALDGAGTRSRGATLVVTLEPCAHVGRTGPCANAVIAAGIRRVVYAINDPSSVGGGGAERMRDAGIEISVGLEADSVRALNPGWLRSARAGRPYTIWKVASTLDGFVSAADGSSRWITGPAARAEVHQLRRDVDAVITGTGTVIADDPSLTARNPDGTLHDHQPLRVVVGTTEVPRQARVFDDSSPSQQVRSHDLPKAMSQLHADGLLSALIECGPRLASSFVAADLIDEVRWYVAPILVGSGTSVLTDIGVSTLIDAHRFDVVDVAQVGADVRIRLVAGDN